jgi:soluble cytochrome b562
MSVAGILSSSLSNNGSSSNLQQLKQTFQQLGQDLLSGNVSAAQSDLVTLQKDAGLNSAASSSQSNNPIAEAFTQLSQALQSGNLSSAQQAYSTLQQGFQSAASQLSSSTTKTAEGHHHHHSGSESSSVSQQLTQLGQALQSGNLTAAQQAFSTLQASLEQYAGTNGSSSSSGSSGLSVTA